MNRRDVDADADAADALKFLAREHRRLLDLLSALESERDDRSLASNGAWDKHVGSELRLHFTMKDEILYPAIKKTSCPSAWGIAEEAVCRHREILGQVESLASSSLKETRPFELLHAFHDSLAKMFSDEEGRLLDEARRHLSPGELSNLAQRMIALLGSASSELP